jgi:hypothetical protein
VVVVVVMVEVEVAVDMVEVEVAVDMVVEDMAVAEDSVEVWEEVSEEVVAEAEAVVAESSLLLSSQHTTLNTEMSLRVEALRPQLLKSDQTLSHLLFYSDRRPVA